MVFVEHCFVIRVNNKLYFQNFLPMRPTKLVADSEKSFADAAKTLINRALAFSDEIKSLRILEDRAASPSIDSQYRVKAHILKRS